LPRPPLDLAPPSRGRRSPVLASTCGLSFTSACSLARPSPGDTEERGRGHEQSGAHGSAVDRPARPVLRGDEGGRGSWEEDASAIEGGDHLDPTPSPEPPPCLGGGRRRLPEGYASP
jgi:hypothetical protein